MKWELWRICQRSRLISQNRFEKVLSNNTISSKVQKQGKLVKGINEGDRVIYGTDKNKKVKDFYQKLYEWEQKPKEIINNGIFNYEIEIDKAIRRMAKDKATGWDNIPGEFFKSLSKSEELKQRLKNNFTEYVMNGKIPD